MAFDATDSAALERFFSGVPSTIDHVMVAAGRPQYERLMDMDFEQTRRTLDAHLLLVLQVARNAAPKVRPGGTSASLLGDELENRRNQLRATLPIRRVVGPGDIADGGQQLIAR